MNFLLHHRFKKIGAFAAPLGFGLWLCMQFGIITRWMIRLSGRTEAGRYAHAFHIINVTIAIVSFLSFLAGLYFLAFSKEEFEDEMIQRTRLDSFQFAALVQMVCIITGFLVIMFYKDPGEAGLMLFFVAVLFVFWLSFIGRFNYILHIQLK